MVSRSLGPAAGAQSADSGSICIGQSAPARVRRASRSEWGNKLYTQLCSAALFPLHERLKRHRSVTMRRELERTQWLDPVDLERLQVASLRDFLVQAGRFVPYYRELYARCGFRPEELSSLDDLGRLPFLTKALIRDNGPQLKSERAKHLVRSNTGGSSGEPLVFYVGPERV